jgi:hypothetical protein
VVCVSKLQFLSRSTSSPRDFPIGPRRRRGGSPALCTSTRRRRRLLSRAGGGSYFPVLSATFSASCYMRHVSSYMRWWGVSVAVEAASLGRWLHPRGGGCDLVTAVPSFRQRGTSTRRRLHLRGRGSILATEAASRDFGYIPSLSVPSQGLRLQPLVVG